MTLVETRFKTLAGELSSSIAKLEGEVSAKVVHRLRTTTRRMESLIAYLHPKLTHKQAAAMAELGALRKRAGKVRDLDVQMDLLKLGIGNGSATLDRKNLTRFLQEKRDRQAERLVKSARKLGKSRLFTYLQKVQEHTIQQPDAFGDASAPLLQAETQITELATEFAAHDKLKPRRLHALRTRLKLVRYQAELAGDSLEKKQFVARMKVVQDALGEWHDWESLCETAEKFFRARANCPLLVEARALYASKYSAAMSAINSMFESHHPLRKQPRKVHLVAASARLA